MLDLLLIKKTEAFKIFKKIRVVVEKEFGELLVLRSDRGEWNSKTFLVYSKDNGIKQQLTTAYAPFKKWRI